MKMFRLPRRFLRIPITMSRKRLQITLNTNIRLHHADKIFKCKHLMGEGIP